MNLDDLDALDNVSIRALVHELRVSQIELELQNDELRRAQVDLRNSRTRYLELYDFAPVGYFTLGEDGRIQEANATATTLLEFERDDLLHQPFSKFIHREDADKFHLLRNQLKQSGQMQKCTLHMVTSSGSLVLALLSVSAGLDERGEAITRLSISDVGQREKHDRELREEEERLSLATLHNGVGIWDWNLATGELIWDDSMFALFRISRADFSGTEEAFRTAIFPADLDRVDQEVRNAVSGAKSFDTEFRVVWPSGETRHIKAVAKALHDASGTPVRLLGTDWDITEQTRVAEALHNSAEFTQSLIGAMQDGFSVLDADAVHIDVNPAFCRMTGFDRDELIGTGPPHPYWPPEEMDRIEAALNGTMEGRVSEVELIFMRKNGERFPAIVSPSSVKNREGKVVSYSATVKDITERQRAEEDRSSLERQLQQAQKLESLGLLAGGIAHDFNNLLTAVIGNLNLALLDLPPVSPVRETLFDAEVATLHAAELARQMLAYSGKGRFVVERVQLAKILEEMMSILKVSISKKADVQFDLMADEPCVEVDIAQLRQIILNLVINASDSLGDESGSIQLSTGVFEREESELTNAWMPEPLEAGTYAFLEVCDSGSGIAENQLLKIFDPFFTTNFAGRGLGLAAVLGIVRGHKGTIDVQSTLGVGTTFRVYLPVCSEPPRLPISKPPTGEHWKGSGKILLVDDEKRIRVVGERMLRRLGFEVILAEDGVEALNQIREYGDELVGIVLDLTMPRMDGEETLRELQLIRTDIPVILSSGFSEQAVVQRFVGLEIAGFIPKPYTHDILKSVLAQALG